MRSKVIGGEKYEEIAHFSALASETDRGSFALLPVYVGVKWVRGGISAVLIVASDTVPELSSDRWRWVDIYELMLACCAGDAYQSTQKELLYK